MPGNRVNGATLTRAQEATIKKHSLDLKHDYQLTAMGVSHQSKLDALRAPYGDLVRHVTPDGIASVKWDLKESGLTNGEVADELFDRQVYWIWKDTTLAEIVAAIDIEVGARARGIVTRTPVGTKFFIDSVNGFDTNDGLNTTATTHSITSSSVANPTNILAVAHGLDSSDNTTIVGHSGSTPDINGDHIVTVVDVDNFTIPVNVTTGGTGGTSTDNDGPFKTFDKYTENARSAGDIAVARRGLATDYDNGTDLAFSSNGTTLAPIQLESDYDNDFGDQVDLSATATATLTFGSKTVTYSADISGVLATGDWIYVSGEATREFAYEVDTVATTTVTLFLPYKGAQAGSGKTTFNIQSPPVWNTVAGNFKWNLNADHCWFFQGIHIRGTNSTGNVGQTNAMVIKYRDCIFQGNGSGDAGIECGGTSNSAIIQKCRFFDHAENINCVSSRSFSFQASDCLFDGDGGDTGIEFSNVSIGTIIDSEFKNHIDDISMNGDSWSIAKLRNCILAGTTEVNLNLGNFEACKVSSEDHDGSLGVSKQYSWLNSSNTAAVIESDIGTTRSGGGAISGKCTPSTKMNTVWDWGRQLLFEIPFYATTSSKKYEVFFRPTATDDWTADPTATELWIELEYWGTAANNHRRITKSTGTIDMNGSTTFTALDVTIAPSQAGVAYLRGYYAKPKESGKVNTFFWDIIPVVT